MRLVNTEAERFGKPAVLFGGAQVRRLGQKIYRLRQRRIQIVPPPPAKTHTDAVRGRDRRQPFVHAVDQLAGRVQSFGHLARDQSLQ